MSPQRYTNDYDDGYDDDEYDGGYEDDEAAMSQALADLRIALGKDADNFTKESQRDVLWNAYYDVGKAKAQLLKTLRKQPQVSRPATTDTGSSKKTAPKPKENKDALVSGKQKIVEEAPKSKGLDVLKEYEARQSKRSLSFVVVGHVDAGKSTLMGRLLLELKYVDNHTIDKYRKQAEALGKESFAFAWVMDQGSEERSRGVTIDIATNYFETPKTAFTILDAPGHRDFIPNMIAGASQADFAILVIDASVGGFERGLKGQTREHVLLLRSLGVQRLIVAVNKLDTTDWSQERFEEISNHVTGFVTGLGFQQSSVDFIPISGLNGDNLTKKIEAEAASWYTGPTLIDALEESQPSTGAELRKPFRMSISEVYRSQQGSPMISGRINSGVVQVGDHVIVQPNGETAHVKSIVVDKADQDWAVAGQNVSVSLTNGADFDNIRVGDVVCPSSAPVVCTDTLTLKAMAFEHLTPMPVDVLRGRLNAAGQLETIVALLDKATGQVTKKKPRIVQPGGVARVIIKLGTKVPLEAGQRIVLRSGGETCAAGLLEQ